MRISRLSDLPAEPVSHDPAIAKRVMLRRGVVPGVTAFSQARIPAGEATSAHAHADMWEVFLVEEGSGAARVDGEEHPLGPGTCLLVEPGERHALTAGPDGLLLTYFGVVAQG